MDEQGRLDQELELLRRNFPDLQYVASGHWVRLPRYMIDNTLWDRDAVEVCFQIPERIPGQAPYGFYVRPGVALRSAQQIGNYAYPAATPFGVDWGKFSWQLETWAPAGNLVAGTNMVNFARSFSVRFAEGA